MTAVVSIPTAGLQIWNCSELPDKRKLTLKLVEAAL